MSIQSAVHGDVKPGSFLTGAPNFFTISTVVPTYPTNVKTPLNLVLASLNATALSSTYSVTVVDGYGAAVNYTSNATYTDALNKQANLDLLIKTFAVRANPVMISVSYASVNLSTTSTVLANGVNGVTFGSAYTGVNASVPVYTVNLATEKSSVWLVSSTPTGSNTNNTTGYQLLDAVQGLVVASTTTSVPTGPVDAGAGAVTVVGSPNAVFENGSGTAANTNIIATVRSYL
jgi:hypothetical protein